MTIDPTTTSLAVPVPEPAVTIPASSFPHIIDAILESASPSVLIAFRNTSTEFRHRISPEAIAAVAQADLEIKGVHLHLDVELDPAAPVAVAGPPAAADCVSPQLPTASPACPPRLPAGYRLTATFATSDVPAPAPRYLAPWVHIVTVHAAALDGDFAVTGHVAQVLAEAKATLDVVRIVDFEGATSKIPFQAPKFVLFMNADNDEEEMELEMDMEEVEQFPLDVELPASTTAAATSDMDLDAPAAESPFPDNVTEIICNIACSPSAGCTNLTRSQLAALNLGHRDILSNVIYIFRPIPEELENGSNRRGRRADKDNKSKEREKNPNLIAPPEPAPTATSLSRSSSARSSRSSRGSSPSSSPCPSPSPALVPFLDKKLSSFPSPDFTIVGCENLRYWDDDPESTLFARFASVMNTYCDWDLGYDYEMANLSVDVEVALGLNGFNTVPTSQPHYNHHFNDLSRSNYFKSFPQWTASHARTPHARAWYELMAVP